MRISNLRGYLKSKNHLSHQGILLFGSEAVAFHFFLDILQRAFKSEGLGIRRVDSPKDIYLIKEPELFNESDKNTFIICSKMTLKDLEELKNCFEDPNSSHKIIFLAEGLPSKSPIVMYFQNHIRLGALGCYEVSAGLVQGLLEDEIARRKIALSKEHLLILSEHYTLSPLALFNDLEKIDLYLQGGASLTSETLKFLINGSFNLSIEKIVESFLTRQKQDFLQAMDLAVLEEEPYLILRTLVHHVVLLFEFLSYRAVFSSLEEAFGAMKGPLFPRTKGLLERAEKNWKLPQIGEMLKHLFFIEKKFKNNEISLAQLQGELCFFPN